MEELLQSLWSSLPSSEEDAKVSLDRIVQHLQSDLTSEERDMSFHLLFQGENSIQLFLTEAVNKNMKKITSEILCCFSFLLDYFTTSLENYVVTIKNTSLSFINRPKSTAEEKDKSLDVLISIFKNRTWVANLDPPSLITQLYSMASHTASKPTVLRKVYTLVGVLAEQLPNYMNSKSEHFLNRLMADLDYQMALTSKVEFSIIEGCFDGLYYFLTTFPLDGSANTGRCEKLAMAIKNVLKLVERKKKSSARAGLNVLARHGDQLKSNLVANYEEWHKVLRCWLGMGKEERSAAKQALLTFYYVLAGHITMQSNTQDMLTFFLTHFKSQFEISQDVDIAIKGFGLFGKAIQQHQPEEIPLIFNILAQKSHEECGKGNHHKIADYLDSLSVFTAVSGVIHNLQISILEGLSVQLIVQFAQEEHPSWQTVMVDAVISTLLRLNRCSGPALDIFKNHKVNQGIVRSVSHPVVEDADILHEAGQKKITTYENYLDFWQRLITMSRSSRGMFRHDLDKQRSISKKLVDKIIESVMDIINRLDLTLKDNGSDEPTYHCDVEKCVEANSPQDFTVLVNLVNFTIALLNDLPDQSLLSKWISPLIQRIIRLSSRHPLVSSFYKLLATIVIIAQKLSYFDDQKDEMEDVDWRPTVNLLSGFLYDVVSQQSQYRGDLQVSCLHLMLATPSRIAMPLLRDCAPAFQTVFRLGRSLLSLAQKGLQTLVQWNQELPPEKMRALLQAVLPSFDTLLQTKGNVADEELEDSLSGMSMVKKALQDQKKKKLWKPKLNSHIDTELGQLQKEIVLFLSTLDSTTCQFMLDGSEDRMGVTAWQEEKLLWFSLPFPDMKVELSLDNMLPHLVHLAVHNSDRRTRSAACELLHAIIMFMLGKEKQLEEAQQGRLTSLWNQLFPKILCLACDIDSIVNQLFAPLGVQMAHWYSSRIHERSEQAAAFLDALLKGITHPTDAALRDYSAKCLYEYVQWSKRQHNMKIRVEPIIKFMASLCLHPCPQKRLGAALAFNSMYTVLRECIELVDEFWIELLYCLMTGLSLCSVTGEDSNTEIQLVKSLRHILRVLIDFSSKFNMDSASRRVPKEMGGGRLEHVVKWLLQYCTALNTSCRDNCRNLVERLAKYVTGCRSTKDFINRILTEGTEKLIQIVEGSAGLQTTLPKSAPWDQALAWVYSLLASMECYMWLIEAVHIPAEMLLAMRNSKLMQTLPHFLEGVVNSKIEQTSLWRPKAMEDFNSAKCFAVVRMIEFLTLVLERKQKVTLASFWSNNFWEVLTSCCLRPSHVGFNSTSKSVEDNLPTTVEKFLKSLASHAPELTVGLRDHFKEKVASLAPEVLERFPKSIRSGGVLSIDRDFVRGLRVLQTVFEDAQTWSGLNGDASLQLVFQSIVEPIAMSNDNFSPVELTPLAAEHAKSMLELFLTSTLETRSLIELSADRTVLHQGGLQTDLTHGEHFVSCFKSTLAKRLLEQPLQSLNVIEELLSSTTSPRDLTILPSLLRTDFRPKSSTWRCLQEVVVCVFSKWERFVLWAQNDSAKEIWLISLLTQIVKLNIEPQNIQSHEKVCEWITTLLQDSSRGLALKTDLLHCLPIVCSNTSATDIKACLQIVKDQHFPTTSSEFKSGSPELINFVRAFEALMQSLVITGNQAILQVVVKVMSVDSKHACRHLLPNTLENFMKQLKDKQDCQVQSLKLVYSMFENEILSIDYRVRILNDFLLKLMQSATLQSQIEFAKTIIKGLIESLKLRLNVGRGNQRLCTQIGSWKLLQEIYGLPMKSLFAEKGSELVQAAFAGTDTVVETGRELTTEITKKAVEVFKAPPSLESASEQTREMCREYMCAVYNMLATLVCNLKIEPSDAKFYDKLLFDESSRKIWRLLVDDKKCYTLPYHLTEHLRHVEKAVSIRRKLSQERQNPSIHRALCLLESQSLAGSLETDITRFDFTHSRLLNYPGSGDSSEEKSVIVLENDLLNDHECMATVCSIIRHLVDSGISPVPMSGTESALPGWMSSFRNSLMDQKNSRNSHIFMLRVVLNCESHFSPHAKHWINPILDCIVRRLLQNGISYLLGDIISVLSKWGLENPSVKVERSQVNQLLQYVIENCVDSQRVVFKYHLELIKSILEVWKGFIDPPRDLLLKMLDNPDKRVGINLTAIMLWHDLIPWTVDTKRNFISFLQNNLIDNTQEVFKASSETLGLCLKLLSKEDYGQLLPENEVFIDNLNEMLMNIHLKQRDCDRFLSVLFGVHENFAPIVDRFVPVILFYLDQSKGDKKAICLSLLTKHLELVGVNPYQELKGRGLLIMMSDTNQDVQMKALQILVELTPSLPEPDLHEVIHELSRITHFVKGEARSLVYEISLICFDRYSVKDNIDSLSELGRKIYGESKALLLSGLVDSNVELQKKCFVKWAEEERLPTPAQQRLFIMFSLMYSPLTEQYFLSYIVPLMLEGTSSTPDFQSTVFAHALEECIFSDHAISSGWTTKNVAAVVPMFAQTFASQMSQTSSLYSTFDASNPLMATQHSLIFQPTADLVDGGGNSKSQLRGNSSFARSGFLFSQDGASYGTQSLPRNNYKQGLGFGARRLQFINEQKAQAEGSESTLRFRRNLGKNSSVYYASVNVRRAKVRHETWKNRARKREAQVSLSRKYRKGDFPDIQIKVSDFVNPLKELAKRDVAIAKQVMVNLFVGVKKVVCTSDNTNSFEEKVASLLNNILESSTDYEPSTIGLCLEISYHCEINLNAEEIYQAAVGSDLLALGVLLLEKATSKQDDAERVWVHLAQLFDGLGERNFAHGTLFHNIVLGDKSKAALSAHAEEQWLQAKNLYCEALSETTYDSFYESCFECMETLSEWDTINRVVREEVDNELDNLWDMDWYERKLLPRLLHSEVLSLIHKGKDERKFLTILNEWLNDDAKGTILKSRFSDVLSIICMMKKNFPQARFFGSKTLSEFIGCWTELSPLFRRRREVILMDIHKIAEVMV
ncbi:hypothetical protein ONE63_002819 [Megalurothrips usitatus]|uniref:DNA-dependent protein kinase catalytic subunit CC3 domain-containing protein n=1 Tax=Megalurothrips usitatus TaxID=439358 RepID=A0AAV7X8V2_9NEOP|nr:hypothetical protein ONE63_002819 [Megalurothrips usitatus]